MSCAGKGTTSAKYNIGIGFAALCKACTYSNISIGTSSSRCISTGSANTVVGYHSIYSGTTACRNTASGYQALKKITTGQKNVAIGYNALCSVTTGGNNIGIGCCAGGSNSTGCNRTYIGNGSTTNTYICGALSKSSGCFQIAHPDPAKCDKYDLVHSFVESPTEGDNIYRYTVETTNCNSVVELPDYYRFLNKNDQVWVSPNKHFGAAYGEVTEDQKCLVICSCIDGSYNVLLIGTRKDRNVQTWRGPEILAESKYTDVYENENRARLAKYDKEHS